MPSIDILPPGQGCSHLGKFPLLAQLPQWNHADRDLKLIIYQPAKKVKLFTSDIHIIILCKIVIAIRLLNSDRYFCHLHHIVKISTKSTPVCTACFQTLLLSSPSRSCSHNFMLCQDWHLAGQPDELVHFGSYVVDRDYIVNRFGLFRKYRASLCLSVHTSPHMCPLLTHAHRTALLFLVLQLLVSVTT